MRKPLLLRMETADHVNSMLNLALRHDRSPVTGHAN